MSVFPLTRVTSLPSPLSRCRSQWAGGCEYLPPAPLHWPLGMWLSGATGKKESQASPLSLVLMSGWVKWTLAAVKEDVLNAHGLPSGPWESQETFRGGMMKRWRRV